MCYNINNTENFCTNIEFLNANLNLKRKYLYNTRTPNSENKFLTVLFKNQAIAASRYKRIN